VLKKTFALAAAFLLSVSAAWALTTATVTPLSTGWTAIGTGTILLQIQNPQSGGVAGVLISDAVPSIVAAPAYTISAGQSPITVGTGTSTIYVRALSARVTSVIYTAVTASGGGAGSSGSIGAAGVNGTLAQSVQGIIGGVPLPTGGSDVGATGTITVTDTVVAAPGGSGAPVSGASSAGSLVAVQNTTGASSWTAQILGLTSGTLYFEASTDSTNGTDGNWIGLNARETGIVGGAVIVNFATTNSVYRGNVSGFKWWRIRSVGALVGTPSVVLRLGTGTGAVFLNSSLPPGINLIGGVNNAQVSGVAIAVGAGASGTGTQRVILSTDSAVGLSGPLGTSLGTAAAIGVVQQDGIAIPLTGTAMGNLTGSGAYVSGNLPSNGFASVGVTLTSVGVGNTIAAQESGDGGTTWSSDGQCTGVTNAGGGGSSSLLNTVANYTCPLHLGLFRLNVTTYGSGTISATATLKITPVPATSAFVVPSVGTVAATPIRAAEVGSSLAADGVTPVVAGSASSGIVVKSSAGNLYSVSATCTAACWLMVFNSVTVPADGATTAGVASGNLQECLPIGAGGTGGVDYRSGPAEAFSVGIAAAISSTPCATKTASAVALINGRAR
jgi:hypothetical protein